MSGKTYVPRWLHTRKTVAAGTIELMDSEIFANNELWPMQLHWLSLTGQPEYDQEETDYGFNSPYGGVARRLYFEIGISQKSDISLNYAHAGAILGNCSALKQHEAPYDPGISIRFPVSIDLPPDTGIVAQVQSVFGTDWTVGEDVWDPGLMLSGYRIGPDGQRSPVHFAGFVPSDSVTPLPVGAKVKVPGADLFNDGKYTAYLQEMILSAGQIVSDGSDSSYIPYLDQMAWRVNPTSGPAWMPNPNPIPSGNIAPFNRGCRSLVDRGPKAYVFPDGVMLNPRQRVSVKVGNLSSTSNQTFDLCLFGLLEVE